MTNEQLQTLLSTICSNTIKTGSFTTCMSRFNGSKDYQKVEEFISTISIFKEIEKIPDNDAIKGLPLLLEGTAATWWQGVKHIPRTWAEVQSLIRKAFSPTKPTYKIYQEIFETKQQANKSTDLFIYEKRALFSQIPAPAPNESMQLDMVFGLLHLDIRHEVQRETITTFDELIIKARAAEIILKEKRGKDSEFNIHISDRGVRCSFCNFKNHTINNCNKKKKADEQKKEVEKENLPTEEIKCYGCGKPGFVRSRCPNCKNRSETVSAQEIEFYSIHTRVGSNVPTVQVHINGINGQAHLDTAARASVAGVQLYQMLKEQGVKSREEMANIRLADGSCRARKIVIMDVEVTLGERSTKIHMIAIPDACDNRTLLGVDFLEEAMIVLNTPQRSWRYLNQPTKWQPYDIESSNHSNEINHLSTSPLPQVENLPNDISLEAWNRPAEINKEKETKSIFIQFMEESPPNIKPMKSAREVKRTPYRSSVSPVRTKRVHMDVCPSTSKPHFVSEHADYENEIYVFDWDSDVDLFSIDLSIQQNETQGLTTEHEELFNTQKQLFITAPIRYHENKKKFNGIKPKAGFCTTEFALIQGETGKCNQSTSLLDTCNTSALAKANNSGKGRSSRPTRKHSKRKRQRNKFFNLLV